MDCAVPSCSNHNKENTIDLINFPCKRDKQIIWLNQLKMDTWLNSSERKVETLKICTDHFNPKYLIMRKGRRAVTLNAIPESMCSKFEEVKPVKRLLRPINNTCNQTSPSKSPMKKKFRKPSAARELFTSDSNDDASKWTHSPSNSPGIEELPHPILRDAFAQTGAPPGRRSNCNKRMELHRLKNRVKIVKSRLPSKQKIIEGLRNRLPKQMFCLLQAFLLRDKKHVRWSADEKDLAIGLYFKSQILYRQLRDDLQFTLPSCSTIKRWLKGFVVDECQTDVMQEFLTHKRELMTKKKESDCVLLFDEMTLKEHFDFDSSNDKIYGCENREKSNDMNPVNHSMIYMLKGLSENWNIPYSFEFSRSSLPGLTIKANLQTHITDLLRIDYDVRAITCDQGSNNRKALKELGVTVAQPYFHVDGKKVYSFLDPPHLIKSLRNNLCKKDIFFSGHRISWKYIVNLYDKNKGRVFSMGRKLTRPMIFPNNFNKMKVSNATRIFSHSVASALYTMAHLYKMDDNAYRTAQFLSDINRLFDILNSRSPKNTDMFKQPLSRRNEAIVNKFLNEMKIKISKWRVAETRFNKKTKRRYTCLKILPCFNGLIQTINAFQLLWEDLKLEKYSFLQGCKTNQDALENKISILRQKGGWCLNPTPYQFIQSYRLSLLTTILKPPSKSSYTHETNNSFSELEKILSINHKMIVNCMTGIHENFVDRSDGNVNMVPHMTNVSLDSFDMNTINYVAGFIINKVYDQAWCTDCVHRFGDTCSFDNCDGDDDKTFIVEKDYKYRRTEGAEGILNVPCPEFVTLMTKCAKSFLSAYPNLKESSHITCKIIQSMNECELFNDTDSFCPEHTFQAAKHFMHLAIRNSVREYNDMEKLVIGDKHEKLKKNKFCFS